MGKRLWALLTLARGGGIGRRAGILDRDSFSDFLLAYLGVGPKEVNARELEYRNCIGAA